MKIREYITAAILLAATTVAGSATTLTWDPSGVGTLPTGNGALTGSWDTSTVNWYNGTSDTAWTNLPVNDVLFKRGASSADGTITLNADITVGNMSNMNSCYPTISAANGHTLTFGNSNNTITVASGSYMTINATTVLASGNVLTKSGGDILYMSGHNASTLQGNIVVSQGSIQSKFNDSFGASSIYVGDSATGTSTTGIYINATSNNGISNNITVNNQGTGAVLIGSRGNVTANTVTYTGGIVANRDVTLTSVLVVSTSGKGTQFTGPISGSGGVVVASGVNSSTTTTGAFTVAMTGNNTYTGTTTVSSGALLMNGTLSSATGHVVVNNTGILEGVGTINRAVDVNSGGVVSAGDIDGTTRLSKVGILTTGDFTLNSGGGVNFDLGASTSSYDQIVVNGLLTLSGTLNINNIGGLELNKAYTLFTYSDGLLLDSATVVLPTGFTSDTYTLTYDNEVGAGSVYLTIVPEPSSWALLVGGVMLVLGKTHRRRYSA